MASQALSGKRNAAPPGRIERITKCLRPETRHRAIVRDGLLCSERFALQQMSPRYSQSGNGVASRVQENAAPWARAPFSRRSNLALLTVQGVRLTSHSERGTQPRATFRGTSVREAASSGHRRPIPRHPWRCCRVVNISLAAPERRRLAELKVCGQRKSFLVNGTCAARFLGTSVPDANSSDSYSVPSRASSYHRRPSLPKWGGRRHGLILVPMAYLGLRCRSVTSGRLGAENAVQVDSVRPAHRRRQARRHATSAALGGFVTERMQSKPAFTRTATPSDPSGERGPRAQRLGN